LLRLLVVSRQRERGDRVDRRQRGRLLRAQLPGRVQAGELRQLDVHEDEVRADLEGLRHARLAVVGFDELVLRAPEEVAHDLAVHLVVLDVEDGLHAPTLTGTSKMKVEPLPGALSTQMRPPCISTNFLVIDSPRPVPPYSEAMVASVCLNSVNRPAIFSGWMPMPVSATWKRIRPFSCATP